jgi:hypothetical protein
MEDGLVFFRKAFDELAWPSEQNELFLECWSSMMVSSFPLLLGPDVLDRDAAVETAS